MWYSNSKTVTITGIDASTAEVIAAITVEPRPITLAAHDGAIWVGHVDGLVSRIDIETREVTDVIQTGGRSVWPIAVAEDIWLVTPEGTITRIVDPP